MKPDIAALTPPAPRDERVRTLLLAFPEVDLAVITQLASVCSFLSVPGAQAIIREGEPSDTIYIVVTGLFAAYKRAMDGRAILLKRMTSGALIGEIGFITGAARTATVQALRNSEVLCLSKDALQRVAQSHPGVLLAVCATVVQRLQAAEANGEQPPRLRTFCLLPADEVVDVACLMSKMVRTFEVFGTVATVTAEQAAGKTSAWFTALEHTVDHVLFLADAAGTAWTKFCLGQSDGIIFVADGARSQPDPPPLAQARTQGPTGLPLFLILLWQDAIVPGQTSRWLARVQPKAHFNIRTDRDIARTARLLSGRGVGVVLSGGGARGLAHVGVLKALARYGVSVDVIGGTSIGGIVAGLYAVRLRAGSGGDGPVARGRGSARSVMGLVPTPSGAVQAWSSSLRSQTSACFAWRAFDEAITAGERVVSEHMPEIRAILDGASGDTTRT